MTPLEKAIELIEKYKGLVYPYIGSSMLTNDPSDAVILTNAKFCVGILIDEILKQFEGLHKPEYVSFDAIGERQFTFESEYETHMTGYDMVAYWEEVKSEIEKM